MDKENFISSFIDPSYDAISKVANISREDYIKYSIDIHNLGIMIRNTLENYNIEYSQPEMLAYNTPFHVSLIIELPLVIMDVGYGMEDNEIVYEVYFENVQSEVSRKYSTKKFENLTNYIIGYLSASTQIYEILNKINESSQTEDNCSGESK